MLRTRRDRPIQAVPLSLETYRRARSEQLQRDAETDDALAGAVFQGFCYGLAAAVIAWLLLSGTALRLLAGLGQRLLALGGWA